MAEKSRLVSPIAFHAFGGLKRNWQQQYTMVSTWWWEFYLGHLHYSKAAIGAVLSQAQDRDECVITYTSTKTLSGPGQNYCVTRWELSAVVRAYKHFKQSLLGFPFMVRSDHSTLQKLLKDLPENQIVHWVESLSDFDFKIEHHKRVHHGDADAISRIPCKHPPCPFNALGTTCMSWLRRLLNVMPFQSILSSFYHAWSSDEIEQAQVRDADVSVNMHFV